MESQSSIISLPKVQHGIESKGVLSFTLENANVSIANALRRVILSDINILGILYPYLLIFLSV